MRSSFLVVEPAIYHQAALGGGWLVQVSWQECDCGLSSLPPSPCLGLPSLWRLQVPGPSPAVRYHNWRDLWGQAELHPEQPPGEGGLWLGVYIRGPEWSVDVSVRRRDKRVCVFAQPFASNLGSEAVRSFSYTNWFKSH